jgi:hypothetical protein
MEAVDCGFLLRRTLFPFLSGREGWQAGSLRTREMVCKEFIVVTVEFKNGCFGMTPLLNKLHDRVVYNKTTDRFHEA